MKSVKSALVNAPNKAPTGIAGFDEITGGGLPRGRTTLLVGGPGSGKTIFALQFLAHALKLKLKLKVVAEGVETDEQARLLRLLNCDEMQGYLFSEPVPRKVFEAKFLAAPQVG